MCREALPGYKTLKTNFSLRDGSVLYSRLLADVETLKNSMPTPSAQPSPLKSDLTASDGIFDLAAIAGSSLTDSITTGSGEWTCNICTFLNTGQFNTICNMCQHPRLMVGSAEWCCTICSFLNGALNPDSCEMCEHSRVVDPGPPPPPLSSSKVSISDSKPPPPPFNERLSYSGESSGEDDIGSAIGQLARSLAKVKHNSDGNSSGGILNFGLNIFDVSNAIYICDTLKIDKASRLVDIIESGQKACNEFGVVVESAPYEVMLSKIAAGLRDKVSDNAPYPWKKPLPRPPATTRATRVLAPLIPPDKISAASNSNSNSNSKTELGSAVRSLIAKFDRGSYSPKHSSDALPPAPKSCGHSCSLSAACQSCCWCTDKREISMTGKYERYQDGRGWVNDADRQDGYCLICKAAKGREKRI
jgi:hypothetical protein